MSGHCHGFILYFLTKKYFIWPLRAVFKVRFFFFLKKDDAKVMRDQSAKSTKAKKYEKNPRPTWHHYLGNMCIVKHIYAFGKT